MLPEPTEQEQAIRSDYIALFSGEVGARVLRHLMNTNFIYGSTACGDRDTMNQNEGQRKSILKILGYCQVLGEDAQRLLGMLNESITDYAPGQSLADANPLRETY